MPEVRNIDTRERILDAAERLFMAHGYDGTSMRQITGEAAVNLAAVNYHFGSKESLMQEVFRRRLDWLNEERLRVLDEMEAAAEGQPLKPSQIVDGFFGTLLRLAGDESHGGMVFLRLLGRTHTEPSEFIRTFLADEYAGVMERYKQALFKALPDVPRAEIVWRFHFMLGAIYYSAASPQRIRVFSKGRCNPSDLEATVRQLIPFLVAGFQSSAPRPPAPRVARPRAKSARRTTRR